MRCPCCRRCNVIGWAKKVRFEMTTVPCAGSIRETVPVIVCVRPVPVPAPPTPDLVLKPFRAGPLDGLTFTVKDNTDLGGCKTSYGSPSWREKHPSTIRNALCVDQLLAPGATCVGKVVADEFTFAGLTTRPLGLRERSRLCGPESGLLGGSIAPTTAGKAPWGSARGSPLR